MDKPPIDFEKLEEFKKKKAKAVEPIESPVIPFIKPDPSLTDPYFDRKKFRMIIDVDDFDES